VNNQIFVSSVTGNPFLYASAFYDTGTGMLYMSGRYYDTEMKRYITRGLGFGPIKVAAYNGSNPLLIAKFGLELYISSLDARGGKGNAMLSGYLEFGLEGTEMVYGMAKRSVTTIGDPLDVTGTALGLLQTGVMIKRHGFAETAKMMAPDATTLFDESASSDARYKSGTKIGLSLLGAIATRKIGTGGRASRVSGRGAKWLDTGSSSFNEIYRKSSQIQAGFMKRSGLYAKHFFKIRKMKNGGTVNMNGVSRNKSFKTMSEITQATNGRETGLFTLSNGKVVMSLGRRAVIKNGKLISKAGVSNVSNSSSMIAHTHPGGSMRFSPGDLRAFKHFFPNQRSSILINPNTGTFISLRIPGVN